MGLAAGSVPKHVDFHAAVPRNLPFAAEKCGSAYFLLHLYLIQGFCVPFYPCDAMLARVFAIATCPSVCPSVRRTPVLCLAERKQEREMYTI